MTKEFNKTEFNEMCLEFLGYKKTSPMEANFSEDWNLIMKVIEKMEELSSNTIFNITLKGDFTISRTIVEFCFHPSNNSLLHLKLTSNPMDDYKHPMYKHHIVQDFDFKNKGRKAAVIHAIWLFLNWYNENKNK
jgi:hypothetical protein